MPKTIRVERHQAVWEREVFEFPVPADWDEMESYERRDAVGAFLCSAPTAIDVSIVNSVESMNTDVTIEGLDF